MAKNDAYHIAREVYAHFSGSKDEFTTQEVKLALRLALENHKETAFEALIEKAYQKAEDSEKKRADDPQKRLFDVGGVLVLGENQRMGLKYAMRDHFERSLKVKEENMLAVVNKFNADVQWFESIKPFWPDGRPCFEAIEEYRKANPQADLVETKSA